LSVVLWIATGAWSLWQKYGAEKKLNQAAVASASKRTPVEPSTTPPPP